MRDRDQKNQRAKKEKNKNLENCIKKGLESHALAEAYKNKNNNRNSSILSNNNTNNTFLEKSVVYGQKVPRHAPGRENFNGRAKQASKSFNLALSSDQKEMQAKIVEHRREMHTLVNKIRRLQLRTEKDSTRNGRRSFPSRKLKRMLMSGRSSQTSEIDPFQKFELNQKLDQFKGFVPLPSQDLSSDHREGGLAILRERSDENLDNFWETQFRATSFNLRYPGRKAGLENPLRKTLNAYNLRHSPKPGIYQKESLQGVENHMRSTASKGSQSVERKFSKTGPSFRPAEKSTKPSSSKQKYETVSKLMLRTVESSEEKSKTQSQFRRERNKTRTDKRKKKIEVPKFKSFREPSSTKGQPRVLRKTPRMAPASQRERRRVIRNSKAKSREDVIRQLLTYGRDKREKLKVVTERIMNQFK